MLAVSGYQNIQPIYEGKRSQLFRARSVESKQKVILKTQSQEHPDFAMTNRYWHSYEIGRQVQNEHIVAYLDIQKVGARVVVVLEDFGAVGLNELIPQSGLPLATFFAIAPQIVSGLQALHALNIIHKDIKPANIVVQPESKVTKIIDLGTAVQRNPDAEPTPSTTIEGTIAYIAPEQTGRTNQIVDHRSDLYSLGVTFYEMLTGNCPFASEEPLQLIHAHLALAAVPPHLIRPDIPEMVSLIVMKLLAKNMEERYQSAAWLLADLERCADEWQRNGRISPFSPGESDDEDAAAAERDPFYNRLQLLTEQAEAVPVDELPSTIIRHRRTAAATESSTFYSTELDMMTILKASQTLSSELELNRLLSKLMRIVIESAGAECGHLLLKSNSHLLIAATAKAAQDNVEVTHVVSAPKKTSLAMSVVHHTIQTNEPVILINAAKDGRFHTDPYIQQHNAKSILCMPMRYKEKISGALYLQNNLIRGAFTGKQVEILQFLIAQAAISLENAFLYEDFAQSLIEYKRTEVRLRNSESRLSLAIQASNLGIWDWNIPTNTVTWSEHIEDFFGMEPGSFDGRFESFIHRVHPEDLEHINGLIQKALTDPTFTYSVAYRVIHPNGVVRWLESSGKVYRNVDGEPYRMTGYVIDVTRRKEEERSTRQRQLWLERVLELGKTITAVTDWDKCLQTLHTCVQKGLHFDRVGIFIYNPETETVQGTYGTDMAGNREDTSWFKASIREDAGFEKVLSSPKGFQYIENLSKAIPRGEAHEMHGVTEHITVAVWAGDKPIAAIAADNGIHHQRMEEAQIEALRLFAGYAGFALENARLLEQVHDREEQLHLALDAANMGTWNWHVPSGTVTWSKQVQHLHGFTEDSFFNGTNQMLWSVIYKPDASKLQKILQEMIDSPKQTAFQAVYRVHLKDGRLRWLEAMGQRIDDAAGMPLRITGTIADITSRKEAEVERERLIDELESRNAELERFTYTVSHDLKSPLITIRGFLGLLERDIERGNQEKVVRDMERIHAAAGRMLNLLDDLLELSRIGRLTNPPTAVSLNILVTEAIELVTGRIEEKQVTVIVQPDMPTVFVDRPRFVEVLQNLIDNAVKFLGDQPNPTIRIGAEQAETEIVCFVQDNGIGIEPKYLERIFNLFERLNPSIDGTGIGLALIKRIVEFHNGRIWAESAGTGQGTTFFFTLPAAPSNE